MHGGNQQRDWLHTTSLSSRRLLEPAGSVVPTAHQAISAADSDPCSTTSLVSPCVEFVLLQLDLKGSPEERRARDAYPAWPPAQHLTPPRFAFAAELTPRACSHKEGRISRMARTGCRVGLGPRRWSKGCSNVQYFLIGDSWVTFSPTSTSYGCSKPQISMDYSCCSSPK